MDLLQVATMASAAGYGLIRYASELPVYPEDTIELIAELSMALLGFSGVASAFVGRDRAYDLVDRMRLNAILFLAGGPLAGCLLLLVFRDAGLRLSTAVVSAAVFSLLTLAPGARRFPAFYRAARDPSTTTEVALVSSVAVTLAATAGLFLLSAALGGVSWPLLGGYCLQLVVGVVVFGRLLNRAN